MAIATTRPGPNGRVRPSLGDQLDRLDGILNGLSDALNESVATAVSAAVGQAVREGVESATREMAARTAATAAGITRRDVPGGRPLRLRLCARWRAATRQVVVSARWVAERFFDSLGASIVDPVRRTILAPRRFVPLVLAGFVSGAAAGVCGPLLGAVLGGSAGFVAALAGIPRR